MTVYAIRLENLRRLVAEFGTHREVADLADVSEGYLREILKGGTLPSGRPKNVGNSLARKLEEGTGKPPGWMDVPHEDRKPAHPDEIVLAPEEQLLLSLFRRASPEIRRLIMYAAKLAK